jgi:ABC-2 type transport system permease protein
VGLVVLTYALWRRGTETRLWPRLRRLPARLTGKAGLTFAAAAVVFVAAGGFIYMNTNVWNPYRTRIDNEKWQADYEKTLLRFENTPQPKIVAMKLDVDLYPHDPGINTKGVYTLENRSGQILKEIHVRFDRDLKVKGLSIEGARSKQTFDRFNYRIFAFDTPMKPGERRMMSFITHRAQDGFRNSGQRHPRGRQRDLHQQHRARAHPGHEPRRPAAGPRQAPQVRPAAGAADGQAGRHPQPPVQRPAPRRRLRVLRHHGDHRGRPDADRAGLQDVRWRESDQVRSAGGARRASSPRPRSCPTCRSSRPATPSDRDRYKGVDLAIYYDPHHPWNIERMKTGMKASLDYYQANFSPYQFRQLRFQEFPGYADFAQSFANTIPWSENLFFIAKYDDPRRSTWSPMSGPTRSATSGGRTR